ncbi:dipeptide ABC transporter ATP-binding protein [Streptomyces guryensis]|uniref:ABC transporter ATP-binding protein n=1 Tax=Streptomyces guryensis TaxID=2886947 RepID=A0A9Q3VMX8_9ACTN|nr:ABC transporter ATP-binding protein [Streptomyces guryensis]MCD9873790.1 ABC transporter ATP-binding protein [Streptomyces guryensis]
MSLVQVTDLFVEFGDLRAVDGLSFRLEQGAALALVGESGSGKSTVASALLGLHRGTGARVGGSIEVAGTDVQQASDDELRRLRGAKAAMVFQDPLSSLDPYYAIGDQIAEVYRVHTRVSRRAARARAVEVLDRVGIPDAPRRSRSRPHEFSGGMRQRALIAMALACEPALLIADEPTTALDVTVQAQILDLLHALREETGMGLLLVTHDVGVAAESVDEVLVMRHGRVVEHAPVADVLEAPTEAYTRTLLAAVPRVDVRRTPPGALSESVTGGSGSLLPDASAEGRKALSPGAGAAVPPEGASGHGGVAFSGDLAPGARAVPAGAGAAVSPEGVSGDGGVLSSGSSVQGARDVPSGEGSAVSPGRASGDGGVVSSGASARAARADVPGGPAEGPEADSPATGAENARGVSAGASGDVVLEASGLRREFGRGKRAFAAVDDVSLTLRRGETLGIVGESGSGKTTLGRMLVGLLQPTTGEVRYEGHARVGVNPAVQMVFQDPVSSLNPRRSVGESIADPLRARGERDERGIRRRVTELLERVGLEGAHYDRYPHEFSGGQRQRVGIARALAADPRVIVCDEPVSALDVTTQAQVVALLGELQRELGLALVFVAHDLAVVRQVSDRVAVMRRGRIVESGPADEVYGTPQDPYTKQLLAAVPALDPQVAARRRAARRELAAA